MSDWESRIDAWNKKVQREVKNIHANASFKVRDSVVSGSGLTGAPGQPVDTGNLKTSFIGDFPEAMLYALETNVAYAPAIEEGVSWYGPMTLRSEVGGFHSVKLTRTGFGNIVRAAVKEEVHD